jgi:hypothetical protein
MGRSYVLPVGFYLSPAEPVVFAVPVECGRYRVHTREELMIPIIPLHSPERGSSRAAAVGPFLPISMVVVSTRDGDVSCKVVKHRALDIQTKYKRELCQLLPLC